MEKLDFRKLSSQERLIYRKRAISLIKSGKKNYEVAAIFGVRPKTPKPQNPKTPKIWYKAFKFYFFIYLNYNQSIQSVLVLLFGANVPLWRVELLVYQSVSLPILAIVCPPLFIGAHFQFLFAASSHILSKVLWLLLDQVVLLGTKD